MALTKSEPGLLMDVSCVLSAAMPLCFMLMNEMEYSSLNCLKMPSPIVPGLAFSPEVSFLGLYPAQKQQP